MSKTTGGRRVVLNKYIAKKWEVHYSNFIMKYSDNIQWLSLSRNPNITFKIVKDNPNKPWNWYWLSKNRLTKERELFMEKKLREHMTAFKIQTYWRRAHYNPKYKLCQEWLMKECDKLGIYD